MLLLEVRFNGQHGTEQVHKGPEPHKGHDFEPNSENQGVSGLEKPSHQWPVAGPPHEGIDISVDIHVDGVGATGRGGAAEDSRHHQPPRRETLLGHDHRGHGRDEQKLDNARFCEGYIPAQSRSEGWLRDRFHRA